MSMLADFLHAQSTTIVALFEQRARQAGLTPDPHVGETLGRAARSLGRPDGERQTVPPGSTLSLRPTGKGLRGVTAEHDLLRDTVLAQMQTEGFVPAIGELRELLDLLAVVRNEALVVELPGREDVDAERMQLFGLFDQAPGFVAFLRGPAHVFELANRAYLQVVGHREVVGKAVRDALPELHGQGLFELLDRVYTTGEPFLGRNVRVSLQPEPGGPLREAELDFIYQPIRGADGRVMGILVQGQDVSEARRQEEQKRQVEAALHSSEERYRAILESLEDAFCTLEVLYENGEPVDYRILEVNPAYEAQTGLRDAPGKTARELVPGIDGSWARRYAEVVETGLPARIENYDPAMNQWFEVYASRVGMRDKRQVALIFKDVSERRRAEQQREHLIAELAKSNAALDQFAYITSHDLKAPLRGIASLASWIEDDLGESASDETRQNLHLMRGRVQRLEALINGILNYSSAGRRRNAPESVDVAAMLAEVIELQALPPTASVVIGDAMPTLEVERVPFQQVFMNLIGNAVKYAQRPDPRVQVNVTDEDAFYHFTVSDNGPGIAPEFQDRIWGLFQKLESRSEVEGTGIGLSVVKKIIESRGGRTWVESELGQGATFHVLWPKRPLTDVASEALTGR